MIFSQGDILKIEGYKCLFLVVSNNAYIKANNMMHVCPLANDSNPAPLHIFIEGSKTQGIVSCEQIKLIDPEARNCSIKDRISYAQLMNISDALQGIFEYD